MSTANQKDSPQRSTDHSQIQGEIPQLLARARAEGSDVVGELLQKYANYLRLLAITHMDARLRARVSPSDVVQETNCDAHRDFPKFRGNSEGEFVAWLRTILVHNLARMIERHVTTAKRDVRREVSLNQIGRSIERSTMRLHNFLAAREETPSSHALRRERAVILADRLADLPEDHRQVIMLRNLEARPFSEVAKEMGRSEGAVRMLWLRAVDGLKRRMQEGEA
ncbi:MAG: sigma-70 family RNA polymerase sigma factor [Planctomycetota bacterium]